MPEPLRRLFPLLLAFSLFLGACAPLVPDSSEQDREHIAALQQKLQQLQEQLAAIETAPPQTERNWQPLLSGNLSLPVMPATATCSMPEANPRPVSSAWPPCSTRSMPPPSPGRHPPPRF